MSYNFQIQYVNTKEFGNVDMLSRLINSQHQDEDFVIAVVQTEDDIQFVLQDNIKHIPVTQKMVRIATNKDTTLQKIMKFIQDGWPGSSKMISTDTEPFYNRRESLSIVDNCIMSGDRVVIPQVFRKRILKQLHKGHQGVERMKGLARSFVYWPRIDAEIADYVKQCQNCAMSAKSPSKTLLSSWPTPDEVLDRVHIDIAGPLRGKYYFILVDAFSKWPEVAQVSTISSKEITNHVNEFISRYGQPKVIVSDNGTQFVSTTFKYFCEERGIHHICTPPYHPQSNGQAERFVDTIKRALEKSYCDDFPDDKVNLLYFLSQYRATPNPNAPNGKSPSECFIGRRLQTPLDLLKPSPASVGKRNTAMEQAYNTKHGAKIRCFRPGDNVYAQVYNKNKMSWTSGEIIERVGDVIYNVLLSTRRRKTLIRSHVNQLRERFSDELSLPDSYEEFDTAETINTHTEDDTETSIMLPEVPADVEQSRTHDRDNHNVVDQDLEPRRSTRNHRAPRRYSPS